MTFNISTTVFLHGVEDLPCAKIKLPTRGIIIRTALIISRIIDKEVDFRINGDLQILHCGFAECRWWHSDNNNRLLPRKIMIDIFSVYLIPRFF